MITVSDFYTAGEITHNSVALKFVLHLTRTS